jgi:hypothetical protein
MQPSDFDFDVISGPAPAPLASILPPRPAPPRDAPAEPASLDRSARRPETPAP